MRPHVDAKKRPQQLNLFSLGDNSTNSSSNVGLNATLYTYQSENIVRIRRWGSNVNPPLFKSEIVYKRKKNEKKES